MLLVFKYATFGYKQTSYSGSLCSALKRAKLHTSVRVAGFKYPVFDTNFESRKTSLDILVKATICYKHLNMFNSVLVAFISISHTLYWGFLFEIFSSIFFGSHDGWRIQWRKVIWRMENWVGNLTFCLKKKKSALALLPGIFNAGSYSEFRSVAWNRSFCFLAFKKCLVESSSEITENAGRLRKVRKSLRYSLLFCLSV